MRLESNASEQATNLVRRPIDGHVLTCSGRLIAQPPWIIVDSPVTQRLYDQWLIDQGREEAAELGDDWLIHRMDGLDAQSMTENLRHLLSDYLFGMPVPQFEARTV